MLNKRVEDADNKREKVESKLKSLLEHRRKLFDVLKPSQVSSSVLTTFLPQSR